MRILRIPAKELTPEHVAEWSEIQRADPSLDSPYFRPEFTQAVAAVRDDVAVAVLEDGGRTCGFFPFQAGAWKIGRPVGWPLSDFQGIIARPGVQWNARDLLRACRLGAWQFDHLLARQQGFRGDRWTESPSAFVDLTQGFEAYCEGRRQAGSRKILMVRRDARAAERRVGPIRFEFCATDDAPLETLRQWKGEQYRRTGHTDVLAFPWVVELLRRLRHHWTEAFSGVLSALYLGEQLAAVHLGMRSHGVLHYWMPAYDAALSRYSPGSICFLELVQAAASQGVRRIDLGKGGDPHKSHWTSGAVGVAEGAVECRPLWRAARRGWQAARRLMESPVLGSPARTAARLTRPVRRWLMYR